MGFKQDKIIIIFSVVLLFTLGLSCENKTNIKHKEMLNNYSALKTIGPDDYESIKKISEKKIYFGHMSVGYEIVNGLAEICKEHPEIDLNIIETKNPDDFSGPVFAHSRIGNNRDPKSKVDDFVNTLDNGLGDILDIAFFKYCFVDVERNTDIEIVLNDYKEAVVKIKNRYPDLKLIHFTVPLRVKPDDLKGKINKIIGRDHNINRNRINNMIRNTYPDSEIFDLAKIQSTYPDNERCKYGRDVYVLVPEYTYDGGHLNDKGAEIVAEQLLLKLSGI